MLFGTGSPANGTERSFPVGTVGGRVYLDFSVSENSRFPVVALGARDFQELLVSVGYKESTKPH